MNDILSICIPTFNRKQQLIRNVKSCINICSKYKIPIFISDNASTDGTKKSVQELKKDYQLIFYRRNRENFGFAYNVFKVLQMSSSKYIWLLGDDDAILFDDFEKILKLLKNDKYDLLLANGIHGNGEIAFKEKDNVLYNKATFLEQYGKPATWMSLLIFKNTPLLHTKYYNHNFEHILEIFNSFDDNMKSFILSDIIVSDKRNDAGYISSSIPLFVHDIYTMANQLNGIDDNTRKKLLISFEFPAKFLFKLRAFDYLNYSMYTQYKKELGDFSKKYKTLVLIISIFPRNFMYLLYRVYNKYKGSR